MIREEVRIGEDEKIFLPIVTMSNGITIRLYDPYDMINATAVLRECSAFASKLKLDGYQTIVVPATKPIPLAWSIANAVGLNLVVLKKELKPYYKKFLEFSCKSITSDHDNTMYITKDDYDHLSDKKVIFFDDVLSTGATFKASKKFLEDECSVKDLFAMFVLKEGDAYKSEDDKITWMGEIPI